jgi:hypothetical protein
MSSGFRAAAVRLPCDEPAIGVRFSRPTACSWPVYAGPDAASQHSASR